MHQEDKKYKEQVEKFNQVGSQQDEIEPNHYLKYKITPYDYIVANKLNWEQGNIVKYVTRYKDKAGLIDLQKAKKYIELLIQREYDGE